MNSTVDKTVGSLSLYVNILTNILNPYVSALVYTDSGNGLYDLEMLNSTVNVCMFFENKQYAPLLQVAYKTLKKEPGVVLPTRCPIIKVISIDFILCLIGNIGFYFEGIILHQRYYY